jgi:4-diphosphocytidyl-2-C-methyl-D-erythritol kinase
MFRTCRIDARCKINLHLEAGERGPEGFHDIRGIFLCLAFGDSITVEERGERGGGLRVEPGAEDAAASGFEEIAALPPEKNLAWRAASLFREAAGYEKEVFITLKKRVPAGAGLGGGSADAAAVLRALDALAGTGMGKAGLLPLAERLGSDVPFFLQGGAAFVTGRGERVLPLRPGKTGHFHFVVVFPGFPSATGRAFALLDAARSGPGGGERKRIFSFYGAENAKEQEKTEESVRFAEKMLENSPAFWPFSNDFLPVLADSGETGQVCVRLIADLKKAGAEFAGLSGSGSGCFGVFSDGQTALRAAAMFKKRRFFSIETKFVAFCPDLMIE